MNTEIKMVVMACPYDQWSNPKICKLFTDVVGLKIKSYGMVYPYGILPVDSSDYVGDHLLLCTEDSSRNLKPIATYRSITLKRTLVHRIKFPLQAMLEGCGAKEHLSALHKIITDHSGTPETLAYQSGWTIDPQFRGDKELNSKIKSMMTALVCRYTMDRGITQVVGAGSCRFKADQYFCKWGFEGFSLDNKELPLLTVPSFYDEESRIIKCTKFSPYALGESEKWNTVWNSRTELAAAESSKKQAA